MAWRGEAQALHHPSLPARGQRRGVASADRSAGFWENCRRAGCGLMEIRLDRQGPYIAIVTIDNQPRLNAMTRDMLAELGRLWDELGRDPCRCIILTGA